MRVRRRLPILLAPALGLAFLTFAPQPAAGQLDFGPEQIVQASGGDILVTGYSVPSYAHWDDDGIPDLIVGEGSGGATPKVRVYLNTGTAQSPLFAGSFYAQAAGADLTTPGSGCLGLFPRTVYWDADGLKDLIVGQALGEIRLFTNIGSEASPTFDAGVLLEVGPGGSKGDISVGYRATPVVVDWNNDGKKDLVVGALDGKIHIYINEGTDAAPDFLAETFAQENGGDLAVPGIRSSPYVGDVNGDGKKDLITGNTNGQLLQYLNTGTDAAPTFSGYTYVESNGVDIDLAGTPRSRPFVGKWSTDDGLLDVSELTIPPNTWITVVEANSIGEFTDYSPAGGSGAVPRDGNDLLFAPGTDTNLWSMRIVSDKVEVMYIPEPVALALLGVGAAELLRRRRRK